MSIKIFKKSEQARGEFDNGAILENKPIGFPQEGGGLKPYSHLFYWAHAWSDKGGLIGEHPHQGFEIMSFVLKGEIEHYDSQLRGWKKLSAGDVQIIRAGKGITHAEKINAGGHIFQIWVDPDLRKTLRQPASYNDFKGHEFETINKDHMAITYYAHPSSPLKMDTSNIEIARYELSKGTHTIDIVSGTILSGYVISGELSLGGKIMQTDDFVQVRDQTALEFTTQMDTRFFVIRSPEKVSYDTYAASHGW